MSDWQQEEQSEMVDAIAAQERERSAREISERAAAMTTAELEAHVNGNTPGAGYGLYLAELEARAARARERRMHTCARF